MSERLGCGTITVVFLILLASYPLYNVTQNNFKIYSQQGTTILSVDSERALKAAETTSMAFEIAANLLQQTYTKSLTQHEVAMYLEALMRAEGANKGLAFPTLVMTGPELSEPHGNPFDDRQHIINPEFEKAVMIDMGCTFGGVCTDITRTYFFEGVDDEVLNAYAAILEAQEAAITAIKDGISVSSVDSIIRSHLRDYIHREDVYFHEYWGHGVGSYVHEEPALWRGSDETLSAGQILAIEPGLWFDGGWAVRVEDVVLVTEDGVTILSNASKSIDKVTIGRSNPELDFRIDTENFFFGERSRISINFSEDCEFLISGVEYHDGYRWNTMDSLSSIEYSFEFLFNSYFSSKRIQIFQINTLNHTFFHFMRSEHLLQPKEEFRIDRGISANEQDFSALHWTISHPGAEMIRIRFSVFDAPDFDQMLIVDSRGMVIDEMHAQSGSNYWTPWSCGDNVTVQIVPSNSRLFGGIGNFSFTITTYQLTEIVLSNSTTQPSISPITVTNSTLNPDEEFFSNPLLRLGIGLSSSFAVFIIAFAIIIKKNRSG